MADDINIMIAVAAHRNAIHPRAMTSIFELGQTLTHNKIRFQIGTIDKSNIALVCDMYGSLVAQNQAFSHLLFLDGEVRFGRRAIPRMLKADKPIVGLACPLPQSTPRFAVTFPNRRELNVTGGLVEVDSIGIGAMLVQRSVFETMIQKGAVLSSKAAPVTVPGLDAPLYNFFHPICTRDRRLTEDASFCARWREQCRGQIFALIDEEVATYGTHEFKGRMLDLVTLKDQPGAAAPAPAAAAGKTARPAAAQPAAATRTERPAARPPATPPRDTRTRGR
jgi:hypothetical protein